MRKCERRGSIELLDLQAEILDVMDLTGDPPEVLHGDWFSSVPIDFFRRAVNGLMENGQVNRNHTAALSHDEAVRLTV